MNKNPSLGGTSVGDAVLACTECKPDVPETSVGGVDPQMWLACCMWQAPNPSLHSPNGAALILAHAISYADQLLLDYSSKR
jgi:hypothetical protein